MARTLRFAASLLLVMLVASAAVAYYAPAFLTRWGSMGSLPGQLSYPHGVGVSPVTGRVFVADTGNNRIQVFSATGSFVAAWGAGGTGTGQLQEPGDVAFDATGNVYVVSDHRVQRFSPAGAYQLGWGGAGSEDGQFQYAMGVAVDATGNVYVTDWMNYRVQKFTATGTFVTKWGRRAPDPASSRASPPWRAVPTAACTSPMPATTASRSLPPPAST